VLLEEVPPALTAPPVGFDAWDVVPPLDWPPAVVVFVVRVPVDEPPTPVDPPEALAEPPVASTTLFVVEDDEQPRMKTRVEEQTAIRTCRMRVPRGSVWSK